MKFQRSNHGLSRSPFAQMLAVVATLAAAILVAPPANGTTSAAPSTALRASAMSNPGSVGARSAAEPGVELNVTAVKPMCCAPVWYPYGWYKTKASCESAGKAMVKSILGAVGFRCTYVSNPPSSAAGRHYHLYILESA